MASVVLSLLPGKTKIADFVVDASLTEQHETQIEVTEHPVEQGLDATDHARRKPRRVTLTGVVSGTPLAEQQKLRAAALFESGLDIGAPEGIQQRAYRELLRIADSRALVTLTTGLYTYSNMVLINLSTPRDAQIGNAFLFTATFQEIRLVSEKRVKLTASTRTKKTDNKGQKATPTVVLPESTGLVQIGAADAAGMHDQVARGADGTLYIYRAK